MAGRLPDRCHTLQDILIGYERSSYFVRHHFMRHRLLRPLLIFEFLLALQVLFTLWSQVGGQYHLDLMFWPWKLGLGVGASLLITGITADLVRADGAVTKRAVFYGSLLIATMVLAGVVTYYYHLNEPSDEDQDNQDAPAKVTKILEGFGNWSGQGRGISLRRR